MALLSSVAAASLLAWSASWTAVVGTVLLRAQRTRRREGVHVHVPAQGSLQPRQVRATRVHLIRPCAGAEVGLVERLVSVKHAQGLEAVHLSVSLTTGRVGDPAIECCRAAAAELNASGIEATLRNYDLDAAHPRVINQKVGQLARAVEEVESDIVINVDSDVDLSRFDFAPVVESLMPAQDLGLFADDQAGAVWVAPIECNGRTDADAASASILDASLHAFGLLGELDPKTLVGKVFAIRSDVLGQVGGLSPLADWLGEDMELARRVRTAGWDVRKLGQVARAQVAGRDFSQVRARYARWLAVIRWQRPHLLATYPLLFFPALLLCAAWGVLAALDPSWGNVAFLGAVWALGLRWVLARGARRASGLSPQGAFVAGLRADYLLGRSWLTCLAQREVSWRGRAFVKGSDGRMVLARSA